MKNKTLYIIIAILSLIIISEGVYIFLNQKDNNIPINNEDKEVIENNDEEKDSKEEDENNNEEEDNKDVIKDGVKLVNTKKETDKIIQEFEITLNGTSKTLAIEYSHSGPELSTYYITGDYNKAELFYTETNNEKFNESFINEEFNENNFKIIKGTDNKSYLAIITYSGSTDSYHHELYILNDNLEFLDINSNDLYDTYAENIPQSFVITTYYNSPCTIKDFN